jgi:hypothetical protein
MVKILLSSIHRESCDDEEDVCSCPKQKEGAVASSVIPVAEEDNDENMISSRMTQDVLQGDPVLGSDAQAGTDKVLYLIQD